VLQRTLTKKLDDRNIAWSRKPELSCHYAESGRRRLVWYCEGEKIICIEGCTPRRVSAEYTFLTDWVNLRNIRQAVDFITGKL
jgi:hypothetical protein